MANYLAVVRYNLNAFYLGLKRANPEAAMNMYWAGTFLNVSIEDYGLESLLNDYDVDVVR
jgi:basic membrane lipoprotein Med (substrate-binding protein (PBP1-ABC) superfamily)